MSTRFRLYHMASLPEGEPELGFNLGEALTYFNFFPFIHPDNRELLQSLIDPGAKDADPVIQAKNLGFFCDIISSLSAQLIYRKMLGTDFAAKALQFFDRALKGYGFKLEPFEHARKIHEEAKALDSVLLIPGCQNELVRNNRVLGGYTIAKVMHDERLKIVFSGRHPPTNSDKASDRYPEEFQEARDMQCRFFELANADGTLDEGYWDEALVEEESTNTAENLQNFLRQAKITNPIHLWVSSSTFHLPRIAKLILNHKVKTGMGINKITLIAAEDDQSNVLIHQVYAKQMMWELFMTFFDVFRHGSEMKELFAVTRSSRF